MAVGNHLPGRPLTCQLRFRVPNADSSGTCQHCCATPRTDHTGRSMAPLHGRPLHFGALTCSILIGLMTYCTGPHETGPYITKDGQMSTTTQQASVDIQIERRSDGVAIICLNRPRQRNAMSLAMWQQLASLYNEFGADRSVRSIVLTGAGGAFCAGADISQFSALRATPDSGSHYQAAVEAAELAIVHCPKPTIAAISGACVGGGLALAVCCDFRFVDPTAYFAVPAAKLGIVYGIPETRLLVSAVGVTRTKEILFSGRRFDADAAVSIGLATHPIVTDEKSGVLAATIKYAGTFAASAPLTIAGAKLVIGAVVDGELDARANKIKDILRASISSQDYKEGVAAFTEKRVPRFTGV
jgi:enoyl-CoA hydratase/carnithine racemase